MRRAPTYYTVQLHTGGYTTPVWLLNEHHYTVVTCKAHRFATATDAHSFVRKYWACDYNVCACYME